MKQIVVTLGLALVLTGLQSPCWAYRDYFTPEQKTQLSKVQTILVDAVALTDRGPVDAEPIREVAHRHLRELGYDLAGTTQEPHDVVFRIKCEQRKTWEGTTPAGGDADLPDAPSRLWKGPACQLSYVLGGMKIKWQKEVRTDFDDAVAAAQAANADDAGAFAIKKLTEKLEAYDFPVLISAEWGQAERLLRLLDAEHTPQVRKLRIIATLGDMQADEALPKLKQVLRDRNLAQQAAVSLGEIGKDGIPLLVEILQTSSQPELQAAAAKGLGRVGGLYGDTRVIDPLLKMLNAPGIDMTVQTEIAWALGKVPDMRSLGPLRELFRKVLSIREPENKQLQNLKEALNWSIKQNDLDGHLS